FLSPPLLSSALLSSPLLSSPLPSPLLLFSTLLSPLQHPLPLSHLLSRSPSRPPPLVTALPHCLRPTSLQTVPQSPLPLSLLPDTQCALYGPVYLSNPLHPRCCCPSPSRQVPHTHTHSATTPE